MTEELSRLEIERRRRERERLAADMEIEEQFIRAELAEHGVFVTDILQLVPSHAPLSAGVVEVLLQALPKAKNPLLVEWIIRLLAATRVKYDATPLLNVFDTTTDEDLKWVVANTLESSGPKDIADWLEYTIRNPEHGRGREMLCMAAGKLIPPDRARHVLREVFDDLPGHAAIGLGRCGTSADLEFLNAWLPRAEMTWIRNEINRAIAKIEKREQNKQERSGK